MSNFSKLFSDRNAGFDTKKLAEVLDAALAGAPVEMEFLTKESFAPSTLLYPYGPGQCPRYWFLAFNGAEFIKKVDSVGKDIMRSGSDAHVRMQENLKESGLRVTIEQELTYSDPPIRAFVDLIIEDFDGEEIPIEIKTTRSEAFNYLVARNEGRPYQVLQLLFYMYIRGDKHGALLYENKNDHRKLLIPITMTPENKAWVERIFDWMRGVYKNYQEGLLPEKPFRSNSKICKACPIKDWCFSKEKGTIKLNTLSYEEKNDDSK